MAKFRFNCSDYDNAGEPIPDSGHGTITSCRVSLHPFLDRIGGEIHISLGTDGKFFFTDEQRKYHEEYWSEDAIINLVDRCSNHGRNLDIEECCHEDCSNEVTIELIEEEPE